MLCVITLYFTEHCRCIDGNTSQPIYVPPEKYSAEHVLQILLDRDISPSLVCSERQSTATFVIDVTKLPQTKMFLGTLLENGATVGHTVCSWS